MSARGIDVYWVCYKVWFYHIMIHYDIMCFQLFCESIGKLASQWPHAPCLLQAIVHLGRSRYDIIFRGESPWPMANLQTKTYSINLIIFGIFNFGMYIHIYTNYIYTIYILYIYYIYTIYIYTIYIYYIYIYTIYILYIYILYIYIY